MLTISLLPSQFCRKSDSDLQNIVPQSVPFLYKTKFGTYFSYTTSVHGIICCEPYDSLTFETSLSTHPGYNRNYCYSITCKSVEGYSAVKPSSDIKYSSPPSPSTRHFCQTAEKSACGGVTVADLQFGGHRLRHDFTGHVRVALVMTAQR